LEIAYFKAQVTQGVEPVKSENIQGMVIRNSPLPEALKSSERINKRRQGE
jgi:hypothetical protein